VPSEESLDTEMPAPGVLPGNTGDCPACGSATLFGMNEDLGYYRRCPKCGYIINLKRRFLRFDRKSRRWQ
jgi:ssDNA-binding Zn-finger/Zn-ribbon topoisomerase 1